MSSFFFSPAIGQNMIDLWTLSSLSFLSRTDRSTFSTILQCNVFNHSHKVYQAGRQPRTLPSHMHKSKQPTTSHFPHDPIPFFNLSHIYQHRIARKARQRQGTSKLPRYLQEPHHFSAIGIKDYNSPHIHTHIRIARALRCFALHSVERKWDDI